MAISVSITRTELALADLSLTADPYHVHEDGLHVGGVSFRRHTATSPYVHGEVLTHAVKAQSAGRMVIDVLASTAAALKTNLDALYAALEQFTFDLTVTIDGTSYVFRCDAADYATAGVDSFWEDRIVTVTASFPRRPIRVS